jgi:hypothetical protein
MKNNLLQNKILNDIQNKKLNTLLELVWLVKLFHSYLKKMFFYLFSEKKNFFSLNFFV